jgi:phospholipid/cholesterol/gamma-HCH transport system substrate-binding protein
MKAASQKIRATIGTFVLLFLVFIGGALIFLGKDFSILRGYALYYAHFNSIEGMARGAPVKLGGVDIGHVGDISIVDLEGASKVRVELRIERSDRHLIKEGALVRIETQGVLGDKFLNVSPGSPASPAAAPGSILEGRSGDSIANVMNKGGQILEQVETISNFFSKSLKDMQETGQFSRIMKNMDEALIAINKISTELAGPGSSLHVVGDKKTQGELRGSLKNLEEATASLASALKKIDEGRGTLGALVNDTSVYDDLKALLGGANRNKTMKYFIRQAVDSAKEKENK